MTLQKYPRTPHLPWSPGAKADDTRLSDTSLFHDREVVVTEKMDGENTSLYRHHLHARSLDSAHHPSRSWIKSFHQGFASLIPEGWRLCGENLYAKHSIHYDGLPSYFLLFSVWDDKNVCLSWDDTGEWAELLGLHLPPILFRGLWDEESIRSLSLDHERSEGYVVRSTQGFSYHDFPQNVGKWVRSGHVQTDEHWMQSTVVPNKLRSSP